MRTMVPEIERHVPPRPASATRARSIELGLLIAAVGVSAGAIVSVQLGISGHVSTDVLVLAAIPTVAVFVLHGVLRIVAPTADPFILPVATAINGVGVAEIYRIDFTATGLARHLTDGSRQLIWTAVAVVAALAVVLLVRDHRRLQRYTFVSMFVAIVLLLLPLVPGLRLADAGAAVWIHVGPLNFQPAEVGKIALAFFFAGFLVTRRDSLAMVSRRSLGIRLPRGRDLGPIVAVWLLALLVIVSEHAVGTGVLIFGMFVVMLYVATGRTGWVVVGLLLAAAGVWATAQVLSYVGGRFQNWLGAFNGNTYDQAGGSYQIVNGLFGLAHGGLIGTGLGRGRPDLTPAASSDFIIASLGEEIGLVGVFAILSLYLLFVSRGLRIGFGSSDDYGTILAAGLTFEFALQCFVVIGGVMRVIPEAGLTTPFLAAGGSSLVANWIIAGLFLRLSSTARASTRAVI